MWVKQEKQVLEESESLTNRNCCQIILRTYWLGQWPAPTSELCALKQVNLGNQIFMREVFLYVTIRINVQLKALGTYEKCWLRFEIHDDRNWQLFGCACLVHVTRFDSFTCSRFKLRSMYCVSTDRPCTWFNHWTVQRSLNYSTIIFSKSAVQVLILTIQQVIQSLIFVYAGSLKGPITPPICRRSDRLGIPCIADNVTVTICDPQISRRGRPQTLRCLVACYYHPHTCIGVGFEKCVCHRRSTLFLSYHHL